MQLSFLLEDLFPEQYKDSAAVIVKDSHNFITLTKQIDIVSYKKRLLSSIREHRTDWKSLFLQLLFHVDQSVLRDYLFKELLGDKEARPLLNEKLKELLDKVTLYPESFFWYFQKLVDDEEVPLNDPEHKRLFLEAFFILLHFVENDPAYRDLTKKIHQVLTGKRYAVVRAFIQNATAAYLSELLLLASKCQTLSKQDLSILRSLAEVVQPTLASKEKVVSEEPEIIWTTTEGYRKIQERIHHIGTVETVDNAREIETARAHGDLRENSEYKFALERRSRLQAELKRLTEQMNHARILTKEDIASDEVSVGSVIEVVDPSGNTTTYTLLGPWDADPDQHILSFQSKLAQSMIGRKIGEKFDFQGVKYTIKTIRSYL